MRDVATALIWAGQDPPAPKCHTWTLWGIESSLARPKRPAELCRCGSWGGEQIEKASAVAGHGNASPRPVIETNVGLLQRLTRRRS
jgi:hypothetical protein